MKAVCPNNPEHKRFITVAHVAEDWIVDEKGNFLDNLGCSEVVAHPLSDNIWTCADCGAEAKVKEED